MCRMLRLKLFFFLVTQFYLISFLLTSASVIDPEWDLPTENELYKYLGAIKNVVDFCANNKKKVDINLAFGLFLTNVNLNHALQQKNELIPDNVRNKIKNIIAENNGILNEFKKSSNGIIKGEEHRKETLRNLLSLLNNTSNWVDNLKPFVHTVEKKFTTEQFHEMYSPFYLYLRKVNSFFRWFPNPVDSDTCLVALSKNPGNMNGSLPQCQVKDLCHDMLERGTNFGYALSHRIVFLLMARFGRGCSVLSEESDRELEEQLCSYAHAEAAYISNNNFGIADLFMEIAAVCAFNGRSQFIPRIWLDNILKFQTQDGCYGETPVKKVKPTARFFFTTERDKYTSDLRDSCNAHTTGLAPAILSAAVRFIIEEYY